MAVIRHSSSSSGSLRDPPLNIPKQQCTPTREIYTPCVDIDRGFFEKGVFSSKKAVVYSQKEKSHGDSDTYGPRCSCCCDSDCRSNSCIMVDRKNLRSLMVRAALLVCVWCGLLFHFNLTILQRAKGDTYGR